VFGVHPLNHEFSSRYPLSSMASAPSLSVVRPLPRYYGVVRLLGSVHEGRTLLASPSVPEAPSASGRRRDLDAPAIRPSVMPGSPTPWGPWATCVWRRPRYCLPYFLTTSAPQSVLSALNGWPGLSTTNASPPPSRDIDFLNKRRIARGHRGSLLLTMEGLVICRSMTHPQS
jgi:hypothetical protein